MAIFAESGGQLKDYWELPFRRQSETLTIKAE